MCFLDAVRSILVARTPDMSITRRDLLRLGGWAGVGLATGTLASSATAQHPDGPLGLALCIALDYQHTAPDAYPGVSPPELDGCLPDRAVMTDIAKQQNFRVHKLENQDATRETVTKYISRAADGLHDGDIFLITYSGHGTFVQTNDYSEDHGQAEAWCLYNGLLFDHELHQLWPTFARGVRIVVVSDSCFSGEMLKLLALNKDALKKAADKRGGKGDAFVQRLNEHLTRARSRDLTKKADHPTVIRALPKEIQQEIQAKYKPRYDALRKKAGRKRDLDEQTKAAVLGMGACGIHQGAADLISNGAFTAALKGVWYNGGPTNYKAFMDSIKDSLENDDVHQTPQLTAVGQDTDRLIGQKPFSIV
jgi:metacaspase-1